MSRVIRFCKVNSLPGTLLEDTMYLYRDVFDRIIIAITDSTGNVIYTTHNTTSITTLIENYINTLIDSPNGIAGLDVNGKLSTSAVQELLSILDLTTYTSDSGSGTTAIRSTITSPQNGQVLTYEYSIRIGITNGSGTWYLARGTVNTYGGDVPTSWSITEILD